MARPVLNPEERRSAYLRVRFTHQEMRALRQAALAAGLTLTDYARAALLDKRPRAKPKPDRVTQQMVYELQSIAVNFRQLEAATGDGAYGQWAQYVGGQLLDRLLDRPDLTSLMEPHIVAVNEVGQAVNSAAHRGNMEKYPTETERDALFAAVQQVTRPLHEAVAARKSRPTGGD